MVENIVVMVLAVIVVGAAGVAWYMENGRDSKGQDVKSPAEKDKKEV